MKYKVTLLRTEEHLGRMPEADYTRLYAMLKDHFEADDIVFSHYDPMPCTVNARIIKEGKPDVYERVLVEERDIKQEVMDAILDSAPFHFDHITEVGDGKFTTDKGEIYELNWIKY